MKLAQQVADKVYPILDGNRHQSSERLNVALVEEIGPLVNRPIELLEKLIHASVPNASNKYVFDEVRTYLESLK